MQASTGVGADRTCEVEAVGMGATSREFLMPCWAILALRVSQSQRLLGAFTSHMSCWRMPLLTGLPSYVSYGPAQSSSDQLSG